MLPNPMRARDTFLESTVEFDRLELFGERRIPLGGRFGPPVQMGYPKDKCATSPGSFARFGLA